MPVYERIGLPNTSSGMQIKSVQRISGTAFESAGGITRNVNVTINPVNPAKTIVIFNGFSNIPFSGTLQGVAGSAQLTSSTNVAFYWAMSCSTGFAGNVVANATVVEFT